MHKPTGAEGDLLHEISEAYWKEFSELVAKTLHKAPKHLRPLLMMQLEDKSSVHGSDYGRYLLVLESNI